MNTPHIMKALEADKNMRVKPGRFVQAVADLEAAIAAKHIWNTDLEDIKYWVSRAAEVGMDFSLEPWREANRQQRDSWLRDDPRWDVFYTPQFMHATSAAKKYAKTYQKFPSPELQNHIDAVAEVGKLADLVKAVKPFVEKGRKPNPDAKPADLTNTGTCAICVKRQKLTDAQKMVHHGFQISDGHGYIGYRVGSCFGVAYKPYELSNEANVAFAPVLANSLKLAEEAVENLNTGKITSFTVTEHKKVDGKWQDVRTTYTKEENPREYQRTLQYEVSSVESRIRMLKSDIELNNYRIQNWKAEPLP